MSTYSFSIDDSSQAKPALDALWSRLQQINDIADSIALEHLDQEDQEELASICRITAGYTYMIIETSSLLNTAEAPPKDMINELIFLIEAHCDDCETALGHVLRTQSPQPPTYTVRIN